MIIHFYQRFDIKFHTSGFGSGDWWRILTWWTMVVLRIVVYGWLQTDGRYWPQSIRLDELIVPLCLLLPPPPLQQWTIGFTVNQTKEPMSAMRKCSVQFENGEKNINFNNKMDFLFCRSHLNFEYSAQPKIAATTILSSRGCESILSSVSFLTYSTKQKGVW